MATTTPDYTVNYDDERLNQVKTEESQVLAETDQTYQGVIDQSDKYFQDQIDASKQWADTQSQLQQDRTDFAIEQIEQQKDQAHKDYLKEQSGAYVDWQKQSNQYGANAEQMAANGLTNTGFSESSQVGMYNTYQNRVATARESFNQAVLNYNNSITEARLQNNSVLAEIAYEALQQQLELSLQGFQYKNNLILESANKKLEIKQMYHQQWLDVLNQINTENALAEDVRQFNETIEFQRQEAVLDRQHEEKMEGIKHEYDKKLEAIKQQYKLAYLEAQTEAEKKLIEKEYAEKLEYLKKETEYKKQVLAQELANEKEILKYQQSLQVKAAKTSTNKSTAGSGGTNRTPSKNANKLLDNADSNKSSKVTIDQKSVAALGKGPLTEKKLAELVANGSVSATQSGNVIKVKSNGSTAAGQAALNKYTWLKY